MIVDKIELMDENTQEAILIIKECNLEMVCFSCPCRLKIGNIIEKPLECIDIKNIIISEEGFMIQKKDGFFGYKIQGKIENLEDGLIDVEGFKLHIDVDEIPKDINEGMYICFETSRIDIW